MTTIVKDGKTVQTVTVTAFDESFVDGWCEGETARVKRQSGFEALVKGDLGDKKPTFVWYENRIKALTEVCKRRKLSQQYVIKDFRIVIKALYNELPVSDAPAAVKKREQREEKKDERRERALAIGLVKPKDGEVIPPVSKFGVQGTVGNDKKDVTPDESDEQLVTRIGMFRVIGALQRVLAADETTKQSARELKKLDDKLRLLLKPAEVAAAPVAPVAPVAPAKKSGTTGK